MLAKIRSWSLEERAGQLLMVGFRSFEQIQKIRPAGAVLFSWSLTDVEQTRALIRSITRTYKRGVKSPLFIAIDHEGGKVLRLRKGLTFFPDAAAVGALGRPEVAFRFGEAMGQELAALGIHMNFAPVLDLGNARSFLENRVWGDDPKLVASLTRAYIEGLHSARVLAVPKHFPGHGGTEKDSHFHLPVISKSFEKLWQEDLVPFRDAMAGGVAGLMTAHVQIPSVDRVPASLSSNFLEKLLKERLGFEGLIITDDLEMAGVSKIFPDPPENLAFRSLQAGTDMLLVVWSEATQERIVRRIAGAVRSGEVAEAWLDQKVLKVQKAKASYFREGLPDNPYWRENVRRPETLALASEIFRKAATWHAGPEDALRRDFQARWGTSWSVVLPEGQLAKFWSAYRPRDRVFIVPRRADAARVKSLGTWLDGEIAGSRPLWVVTGPRASSSEESFQLVKDRLAALASERTPAAARAPILWAHQGARPVSLVKPAETLPFGIVSLYTGSLTGFRAFVNSIGPGAGSRQLSARVGE